MQSEEYEMETPAASQTTSMSDIDAALLELGMLSSVTESRRQYLHEIKALRPALNVVEMNTRFVNGVSFGCRIKRFVPQIRARPYNIPGREERHRTKSENADVTEATVFLSPAQPSTSSDTALSFKRAKSLENIRLETSGEMRPFHEVELVSDIEKLKMQE